MKTNIANIKEFPPLTLAEITGRAFTLAVNRKQRIKSGATEAEAYIGLSADASREDCLCILTKSADAAKHNEELNALARAAVNSMFQSATDAALKAESENKIGEGKSLADYVCAFIAEYGTRGPGKAKSELQLVTEAITALDKTVFGEFRKAQAAFFASGGSKEAWKTSNESVAVKTKTCGSVEKYAETLANYNKFRARLAELSQAGGLD